MGGGPQAGGGGAQTAGAGAAGTTSGGSGDATSASGGGGGAQTGSDDGGSTDAMAGMTCPSAVAADTTAAQRKACTFKPGALVADTLGLTAAARQKIPLKHIIVMMKENRSYDHYFEPASPRTANRTRSPCPPTSPIRTSKARPWRPFIRRPPAFTTIPRTSGLPCTTKSTRRQDGRLRDQWRRHHQHRRALRDGLVRRHRPAFYYFLANTFALADHYFASARTGTWPNRDYLLLATSDGVTVDRQRAPGRQHADHHVGSSTRRASAGARTHRALRSGMRSTWTATHAGVHDLAAFKSALADGTLPSVAFVDGAQ